MGLVGVRKTHAPHKPARMAFEPPLAEISASARLLSLVKLMRPRQWAKNVLVFAAPLFAGGLHASSWGAALVAFFAMSFVSSGTYVFNDLIDVERDRHHPKKRFRPLASGAISRPVGVALGVTLLILSFGLAASLNRGVVVCLLIYLAMQVAYNARLKHVAIADVYTIAVGFVLRAILGAVAVDVGISGWLLFCTGSLALMLGFAKRRHEFILQSADRSSSRESLVQYTRPALDAIVILFAAAAAMSYGIYSLESTTAHRYPAIILTVLPVLYGITRYLLIVFSLDEGGEPADLLFKDTHIVVSVVAFVLAAVLAMSGLRLPIIEQ